MAKEKERLHRLFMSLLATLVVLSLMGGSQRSEAFEFGDVLEPVKKVKGKLERRRKKVERMREAAKKDWHYGAYLDVGYLPNLSSPDADEWRSKTTDFKLNSPEVNLARRGWYPKPVPIPLAALTRSVISLVPTSPICFQPEMA
jgi:hypothetical protein